MAYATRNCASLVWGTIFFLSHPFQETAPGSMLAPRTAENRILAPNCVDVDVWRSTKASFLFSGKDKAAC